MKKINSIRPTRPTGEARPTRGGGPRWGAHVRWRFCKNTTVLFDINATTLRTILTDITYARKPSH